MSFYICSWDFNFVRDQVQGKKIKIILIKKVYFPCVADRIKRIGLLIQEIGSFSTVQILNKLIIIVFTLEQIPDFEQPVVQFSNHSEQLYQVLKWVQV